MSSCIMSLQPHSQVFEGCIIMEYSFCQLGIWGFPDVRTSGWGEIALRDSGNNLGLLHGHSEMSYAVNSCP